MTEARKILKGCEKFLRTVAPQNLVYQLGLLFTVNNFLAQLANRVADVPLSIKYLEAAIESCLDPRTKNLSEIPIAETYLNIANANCFVGNSEDAIVYANKASIYASKACEGIELALLNTSLTV